MIFSPDMLTLEWFRPDGFASLAATRKLLRSELLRAVTPEVFAVWGGIVPVHAHKKMSKQVQRGVKRGLTVLLLPSHTENLGLRLQFEVLSMPSYWEPPVAGCAEPEWPTNQLQAYRWAAAVIAYAIRNELEQLHADYTSDDVMPELNRRIRNATYTVLLQHPAETWRLIDFIRAALEAAALGVDKFQLPHVAG
jgi:hypothetical protein